ncbi:MAG: type II toxin-antitoxin system MqsA family antitoxin [Gammaproteobacteria bacterium]
MKCPNCGKAELVHGTRDMPYVYKGETKVIPTVVADYCPACGEGVMELGESVRTSVMMLDFNKEVNASFVDPEFIVNVRKKLHLDQKEAAEIFGGGVNAFSRYENGKTRPPLALVQLLKVLDRHPDLINEVIADRKPRLKVTSPGTRTA